VYGLGFHTYTAFRVSPLIAGGVLLYFFLSARKEAWMSLFLESVRGFRRDRFRSGLAFASLLHSAPGGSGGTRFPGAGVQPVREPVDGNPEQHLEDALMFFFTGDQNWRHNYAARAEVFWPVAILFAVGIGIALASVWKAMRERRIAESGGKPAMVLAYALLLVWVAVGAIPAVLSGEGVPHALRSVLMIPAVFCAGGGGRRRRLWATQPCGSQSGVAVSGAGALSSVCSVRPLPYVFRSMATVRRCPDTTVRVLSNSPNGSTRCRPMRLDTSR